MKGVNKAIIVGNLGADPESRVLPNGSSVTNCTIATSEHWKDKDGKQQERTEWHRVCAFGKLAEIMGQYLHKGSKVYIEGSLRTRPWEKDGQKHYTTEIVAREMQMLDSKTQSGNDGQSDQREPATQQQDDFDDDIPF